MKVGIIGVLLSLLLVAGVRSDGGPEEKAHNEFARDSAVRSLKALEDEFERVAVQIESLLFNEYHRCRGQEVVFLSDNP